MFIKKYKIKTKYLLSVLGSLWVILLIIIINVLLL